MNDMVKNLILWLVIAGVLVFVFSNINQQSATKTLNYSEFVTAVNNGEVKKVKIEGLNISGEKLNGDAFKTVRPPVQDDRLVPTLLDKKVVVEGAAPEQQSVWMQLLVASFPVLLIVVLFMFFMRQMQGGAGGGRGGPMTFGKSRARLLSEDQIKTTFADVAGCDEAKEDVKEIVEFLRDPGKFQKLGGKIPRGILMVGPPGTGKTLLAKSIAGEAKVPFFSISGSDFVEMFVGVGASRVRDMFEQAKKQAPCIIFIDEIDAVGRHRGAGLGGGHDEREQTLNQLLVEMDGFETNDGIIVIAATNRPDVLDNALLRPGRFDRQVVVGLPDIRGREQILKVHMRKVPLGDDVDPAVIARGTPGFSGADLANLVNEAALFAARGNKKVVSMHEFEQAKDKITMGAERKSMVMSEAEKELTAWHEAGHAVVGCVVQGYEPVHKVTIIPRGWALGVTHFLPEADRLSRSVQWFESAIAVAYGGRIAEVMLRGRIGVTTGASQDISHATGLARNMVTKWGFSEKMGPLLYEEEAGEVFLGRSVTQQKHVSEKTAQDIDAEVRRIIDGCYETARRILEENRDKMQLMVEALMTYETIDREQIDAIMAGRKPNPPKGWGDKPGSSSAGVTVAPGPGPTEKSEPDPLPPLGGAATSH
ncbi:MAG TPA: ATP-dependent zinc metalloprotease FtsH [Moraxellaceae bacterium]|nr:ATP-dependent zinc metalloprotease FtsH [Moraxellaceae bacterium]